MNGFGFSRALRAFHLTRNAAMRREGNRAGEIIPREVPASRLSKSLSPAQQLNIAKGKQSANREPIET
jgi:hypothetical protein